MYDFIAIIEANKQMHEQFRDAPNEERPEDAITQPMPLRAELRLRLSAALHALANAIEPAPAICEPTTSQHR